MDEQDLNRIAALVLVSDKAQEKAREKFGCKDLKGFISKIAAECGVSDEGARRIINDNPRLLRIAFIIT
jgi:hypothetical protein